MFLKATVSNAGPRIPKLQFVFLQKERHTSIHSFIDSSTYAISIHSLILSSPLLSSPLPSPPSNNYWESETGRVPTTETVDQDLHHASGVL